MNFNTIDVKITEMNYYFNNIEKSKHTNEFEFNYNAFISSARSIILILQDKTGIKFDRKGNITNKGIINGFSEWYINKKSRLDTDELCKYFKENRNSNIHSGKSQIQSSYTIR